MTQPLHDQAARDRFEKDLGANFCVSAGAGAGKTTAIVRRIAEIARQDPEALSRLVVVTYARSAAEELRVRARSLVLRELAGEGGRRGDLLPRFRQAFFGTIHSFCLKLVREYGSELGIPPESDLLEEENEEEIWARYCESAELESVPLEPQALEEVTRFLSFDEILDLANKIEPVQAERILGREPFKPRPHFDFSATLAIENPRSPDSVRGNQEMLRRFVADFDEGAAYLRIPSFTTGGKKFLEAYREEMLPFASWLDAQAARLASQIALGYRDFRRAQALMTYPDQIAWCRRLLDFPAILEELRSRDWIVLLDEAQDTDAAMFAILNEVTRPPGAIIGEWPAEPDAAPPRPGRFSFVGDEQQSIYAGRASLAVYRKYINAFDAGLGGERLEFSVTMRCPERVICVVNAIFFQDARLKQTHFSFRELHPKPGCARGGTWILPLHPLLAENPPVEAAFQEECRQVAALLSNCGLENLGVGAWSEVAILCPRKAWLADATEIFTAAGLPCRLISKNQVQADLPEISWPAALLHVLLNPWDRFELIGVLREIFAVSDVELADAQAENKPFTFWSANGLSPRLAAALELLRKLHAAAPPASAMTLAQYVDHVLNTTRLAARLDAIGQRADALPRLRLEALRAEIAATPLRVFTAQLVRNLRRPVPEIAESNEAIQLLTCQKAKGLEWPVVIPLGLARPLRAARTEYPRIEETAGEIAVHISNVTVDEELKKPRDLARREENQRLFYVTLTRPKSLLILPQSQSLYKTSKDSFLDISRWDDSAWGDLFDEPGTAPVID
jgi:ATP-dependent exoDNAse (exonuclease V) beta subunit